MKQYLTRQNDSLKWIIKNTLYLKRDAPNNFIKATLNELSKRWTSLWDKLHETLFSRAGNIITTGYWTMSGLIEDLTNQTFVLLVMLTGHIWSYWNKLKFPCCKKKVLCAVVCYQHESYCMFGELSCKMINKNCLLPICGVLKCKLLVLN
jgi:hypothetical protein